MNPPKTKQVQEREQSKPRVTFFEELRSLLSFLQSLWGILSGISILFPLSTAFLKLVPLEERWQTDGYMRGFSFFKPPLVSALTTVIIIFVMFWLVSQRNLFEAQNGLKLQRRAVRCFVGGIFSLIFYLAAYEIFAHLTYSQGIYKGNPELIAYDVLLLISYAGFFVLLTAAFTILGMVEYFAVKEQQTAVVGNT